MNKKILMGSLVAVVILIFPSSLVIGTGETITEKYISEHHQEIKSIPDITLIMGKISNLTLGGGYSPHYFFHIDKCLTFSTFIPFFRIRNDCNAQIVIPSFNGFINDNFIFGITGAINIYN